MANKTNLALEIWISLAEEAKDAIRFFENNRADMLSVCALVEKNIQS